MNNLDTNYQSLLQDILDNGVIKEDRTGTGTLSVFGRQIRHKMSEGFPLLTTKEKIMGREFRINMYDVEYEIFKYLNELTSSYYADKVTDFIKENVKFIY